jgi:hypothetical protein
VLTEAGRDPLVPGGLVIPAAGFGIGLQSADVVELRADRRDARWVGDEEVALFADVGVGARSGGFGAGAEAVRQSGFSISACSQATLSGTGGAALTAVSGSSWPARTLSIAAW